MFKIFPVLLFFTSLSSAALQELADEEMQEVSGREGLLSIDRYEYPTSGSNNNFYRLTINSEILTSLNVDRLLLSDADGNPQIDFEDLSLSGGVDGSVSSAQITNPFLELAFAGGLDEDNITNREFIGARFGAESVDGVMSFGDPSRIVDSGGFLRSDSDRLQLPSAGGENGINAFRGFLQAGAVDGNVGLIQEERTADILTSTGDPVQLLVSDLTTDFIDIYELTLEAGGTAEFLIADQSSGTPEQIVLDLASPGGVGPTINSFASSRADSGGNATRTLNNGVFTQANIQLDIESSRVGLITGQTAFEAGASTLTLLGTFQVTIPAFIVSFIAEIIGLNPALEIRDVRINGGASGTEDPLALLVNQDLRLIHRANLDNAGSFLSFQNRDLAWDNRDRDSNGNPIIGSGGTRPESETLAGWWLDIQDPVELGFLEIADFSLPQNVVQDISGAVGDYLEANAVGIPNTIRLLFQAPLEVGPDPFVNAELQPNLDSGIPGLPNFNVITNNSLPDNASARPIINCWTSPIGCKLLSTYDIPRI